MAKKFYILDMRSQKIVDDKPENICVIYQWPSQISAILYDLFAKPLPLKKIGVIQGDETIFNKVLEYNAGNSLYMTAAAQKDIAKILLHYSKNTRSLDVHDEKGRLFSRVDSDKMQVLLRANSTSLAFVDVVEEEWEEKQLPSI